MTQLLSAKRATQLHAVKFIDGADRIGGYAVRYGDDRHTDLSETSDYFTADTDYWLDKWDRRPMLYQHGYIDGDIARAQKALQLSASQEETDTFTQLVSDLTELKLNPVVGVWDSAKADALGIWLEGELDKSRKYRGYIKRMIEQEALAQSSDSAPHLVMRQPQANGSHKVIRWPIVASSLTPTPAEPRLLPVEAIKSAYQILGITPLPEIIQEAMAKGGAGDALQSAKALGYARLRVAKFKLSQLSGVTK